MKEGYPAVTLEVVANKEEKKRQKQLKVVDIVINAAMDATEAIASLDKMTDSIFLNKAQITLKNIGNHGLQRFTNIVSKDKIKRKSNELYSLIDAVVVKILTEEELKPLESKLSVCRVLPIQLIRANYTVFGFYHKGNLVGTGAIRFEENKIAQFGSLWVDKSFRKRGLGTAIVQFRMHLVDLVGANRVLVSPLHTSVSIYRKLGFKEKSSSHFGNEQYMYQCTWSRGDHQINFLDREQLVQMLNSGNELAVMNYISLLKKTVVQLVRGAVSTNHDADIAWIVDVFNRQIEKL